MYFRIIGLSTFLERAGFPFAAKSDPAKFFVAFFIRMILNLLLDYFTDPCKNSVEFRLFWNNYHYVQTNYTVKLVCQYHLLCHIATFTKLYGSL